MIIHIIFNKVFPPSDDDRADTPSLFTLYSKSCFSFYIIIVFSFNSYEKDFMISHNTNTLPNAGAYFYLCYIASICFFTYQ